MPTNPLTREQREQVQRAVALYFNKGRCSGHDQFNGKYCRDAAGPEQWCIHCVGYALIASLAAIEQRAEQAETHAARLREALEAIVALDFKRDERGRHDFYSGPDRFVSAWLLAAQALGLTESGAAALAESPVPTHEHRWINVHTQGPRYCDGCGAHEPVPTGGAGE